MAKKQPEQYRNIPEEVLRRFSRFREITIDNAEDLGWISDWQLVGIVNPDSERLAFWAIGDHWAVIVKFDGVWAAQFDDFTEYNVFSDTHFRNAADVPVKELMCVFRTRWRHARIGPVGPVDPDAMARKAKASHAKFFKIRGALGTSGLILSDRVSMRLCLQSELAASIATAFRTYRSHGYSYR